MAAVHEVATTRAGRWLPVATAAAVVLALVVAGLRARWEGWYPLGDNAFFGLRALDVGTVHHPLIGTGSSASTTTGTAVSNPGPLWFDWLAPATRIAPVGGLALATVAAHVAATVGLTWAAWRAGAARFAVLAAAMAAALVWTTGSGLLVEPWQPHAMLLPALAYLVLVWAVVAGEDELLPWAAGVGSLLLQTHLTYLILVPGLAALALGAVLWRARRASVDTWRRPVAITLVVLAVAWIQPLVDQLWGRGNLGTLLGSAGGGDGTPVGTVDGARYVAAVVTGPTWWHRSTFADAFSPVPLSPDGELVGVPSAAGAALGLVAVLALALAAGWWAHRRRDRVAVAGVLVAATAVALAVVTAALIPVGPLGLGPHQLRYLWPVSLLVTGALAFALLGGWRRWPVGVAVVALVLAGLALPAHHAGVGLDAVRSGMPVARSLFAQLDDLDRATRYAVDAEGVRLYEPFTTPLMFELRRRGIDFTVDHEFTITQLGDRRRGDGSATVELYIVEGPQARQVPRGHTQVARVDGLTATQAEELHRLTSRLRDDLAADGLRLSPTGRRAQALGQAPSAAALAPGAAGALIEGPELGRIVRAGYVELTGESGARLARWAELDLLDRRDTLAVNARPLTPDGP